MEMNRLINDPAATIVDVRSVGEFRSGHVEGAVNIPLDQLEARLDEFNSFSKPLILCCASGGRSGMATEFLQSQGFTEVYNAGGWHQVQIHKM